MRIDTNLHVHVHVGVAVVAIVARSFVIVVRSLDVSAYNKVA
jgi:hypothetical protein